MNLGCTEKRAFTDNDVKLLTIIATQLALGIERVKNREKIETLGRQLQRVQKLLQQAQAVISAMPRLSEVAPLASAINHGINNALAVVVGNAECLLSEKAVLNQKSVSRLRRIEGAALHIASFNRQVLDINALVQKTLSSVEDAREPITNSPTYDDV